MTHWSLSVLLSGLHDEIQRKLEIVRQSLAHPGTKGDASEKVWLDLLQTYLPQRYQAAKAHVVDSKGVFSEQIDVVIFDRQYSPFIFYYEDQAIIPAESVYAVFEAKQSINAAHIEYAQQKIASVRRLHRTSLPIPYAKGTYPAKPLIPILGGVLAFESDWTPAFGQPFHDALTAGEPEGRLDLGCIAAHGYFSLNRETNALETFPGWQTGHGIFAQTDLATSVQRDRTDDRCASLRAMASQVTLSQTSGRTALVPWCAA